MLNQTISTYHDGRQLPTFTLRQIDLPDILKWQVNGQYYLVMKVELTGIHNMRGMGGKEDDPKMEAGFQVISVRAVDDKPIDAKAIEKQDFNDVVVKVKSGGF